MSKKRVIALIAAIVLLFAVGVSAGTFLYTKSTIQVAEKTQAIQEVQQIQQIQQNQENNKDAESAKDAESGQNADVNSIGETTIERVEEREKLVSKVYWDWWTPMKIAFAKSNVNIVKPQISVKKSVITGVNEDKTAFAGQDITYVISVTNNSDFEIQDTEIMDKIPQNTTFVSIEDAMINQSAVGTKTTVKSENTVVGVKWMVTIPAGKTAIAKFTVKVNDIVGTISNIAIANGEESQEVNTEVIKKEEPPKEEEPVIKPAEIDISKSGSRTVKPGEEIEYTITLTNSGDVPATVTVSDVLQGTTYVEKSSNIGEPQITIENQNQVLTWNNVQVNPSTSDTQAQSTIITFRAKTSKDSFGAIIKNAAKAVDDNTSEEKTSNEVVTTVDEMTVKCKEYVEGQKGTDLNIIFVLDNSSSMNFPVSDKKYNNNDAPIAPPDVSKTRLDNAKTAIINFIDGQKNNKNTSMSLITFNKETAGTETRYKTLINESDIETKQVGANKRVAKINGVEYEVSDKMTKGSDGNKYYYVCESIDYGARLVGTNSGSNDDLKAKVENISISSEKSGFGTYVSPAFKLINENAGTYLSNTKKNIVIVLADGKFNGDYSAQLNKLKENVDEIYCVGFGSGKEYDEGSLKRMSTNNKCYAATDSSTLLNKFNEILESASGNEQTGRTVNGKITFNPATKDIKFSAECPITATTGMQEADTLFECKSTADLAKFGLVITDGRVISWDAKVFAQNNPGVMLPDMIYIKYYIPR